MSIITVESLSKSYRISHSRASRSYKTFREAMVSLPRRLFSSTTETIEDFWAIDDVSFEVEAGERVGIIGRNGAGKSTLLKILSKITRPTRGRAVIHGRVASLLEVGTGFHPELTGRENIFMNGALLGMTRREILRKFDEIIAFAEVEKFLDTPVKRYSSGMYVRLAFAVAAHLEPEILIIDEVLAVGDAQFQKKCLGKMEDVSRSDGRTVLFVSHNMAAVENLCSRGIILSSGEKTFDGSSVGAIQEYLRIEASDSNISSRIDRSGDGEIRVKSFRVVDISGNICPIIQSGQTISMELCIEHRMKKDHKNVLVAFGISNSLGTRVVHLNNETCGNPIEILPSSCDKICVEVNRFPLAQGRYSLTIFISTNGTVQDWVHDAAFIDVESGDFFGTGKTVAPEDGAFLVPHNFTLSNGVL